MKQPWNKTKQAKRPEQPEPPIQRFQPMLTEEYITDEGYLNALKRWEAELEYQNIMIELQQEKIANLAEQEDQRIREYIAQYEIKTKYAFRIGKALIIFALLEIFVYLLLIIKTAPSIL